MVTAYGTFNGRPDHRLALEFSVSRQEGNRSLIAWTLYAQRTGAWFGSFNLYAHDFAVNIGGRQTNGSATLGFTADRAQLTLASGEHWFDHDSAGSLSLNGWASMPNADQFGSAITSTERLDAPRLAKAPSAPGILGLSHQTSTGIRVTGIVPADNGSPITQWQFQVALDAAFTNRYSNTDHNGHILDLVGLAPGRRYYFRLRARNGVGWSVPSPVVDAYVGLSAPTLTDWMQIGDTLRATWDAPSDAVGVTGYRLQLATDAEFTKGIRYLDVGNVLTRTIANLEGGRRYWVRLAARTPAGLNAWSASRSAMLVLASGDLNGWTRTKSKPSSLAYFTDTGIRRGAVNGAQALHLESNGTGVGNTIPADTLGIQRRLTGLTPGATYRFTARMTGAYNTLTANRARTYRLEVDSLSAAPASLHAPRDSVDLPPVEFIARDTSAVLRIVLAEPLEVAPLDTGVERVAFHGIRVAELNTDYPQRLRNTVYESNLANHFDLACNSVGATWYVAKDGVTRFAPPASALPVSAVFADVTGEGYLEYVDIAAGYDTTTTVNRVEATNYGAGDDGLEQNDAVNADNAASQKIYGVLAARVDLNLWDQPPYHKALSARIQTMLADHAEPQLYVSEIRWNAQQDLAALTALEIGQRITVLYRGTEQDSQIVGLAHDIQPSRLITTLTLQKL